jgi:hypothetical protein
MPAPPFPITTLPFTTRDSRVESLEKVTLASRGKLWKSATNPTLVYTMRTQDESDNQDD